MVTNLDAVNECKDPYELAPSVRCFATSLMLNAAAAKIIQGELSSGIPSLPTHASQPLWKSYLSIFLLFTSRQAPFNIKSAKTLVFCR